MLHRGSSKKRRSRGQSLVEFAIVLPVFLLILSGIMDFGFLLYSRMSIINAARDGARFGVTLGDTPTQIVSQVRSQVSGASGGLISNSQAQTQVAVVCVRTNSSCTFTKSTPAATSDVKPTDSIKVTVNYPYRPFFPLLFGQTINIASTVQMSVE
jgi:Flp pilus assembly protein TadG